jgi:hypothetical protein
LGFEERYKIIGRQVCKVLFRIIFGREQLRKFPKISSQWDLFPEPDCVTSTRWAQLQITFSLREKMARESPKCSLQRLIAIIRTRPGPELYLCYQARARADFYSSWLEKSKWLKVWGEEYKVNIVSEFVRTERKRREMIRCHPRCCLQQTSLLSPAMWKWYRQVKVHTHTYKLLTSLSQVTSRFCTVYVYSARHNAQKSSGGL